MTESKQVSWRNPLAKLASIWADARKHKNGPMVLGGVFLILVGALAAVGSAFAFSGTVGLIVNGSGAEGTVTDMETTSRSTKSGASYSYYPIVSFRARNEQMYTFTSNFTDNSINMGDRVRVLYNSSNPRSARIDSFGHLWGGGILLLVLGLVFGGVGVVMAGPLRSFIQRHGSSGTITPADIEGKTEVIPLIMSVFCTLFGLGLFTGGIFVLTGQTAEADWPKSLIFFFFGAMGLFLGIGSFFAFKPSNGRKKYSPYVIAPEEGESWQKDE